jgi:hypothetical protein
VVVVVVPVVVLVEGQHWAVICPAISSSPDAAKSCGSAVQAIRCMGPRASCGLQRDAAMFVDRDRGLCEGSSRPRQPRETRPASSRLPISTLPRHALRLHSRCTPAQILLLVLIPIRPCLRPVPGHPFVSCLRSLRRLLHLCAPRPRFYLYACSFAWHCHPIPTHLSISACPDNIPIQYH